jgi:cytoskeletal protein RodZ
MQSVGTRLREARIKKGYTLEDINARTRISLKNLNAIESDDLSKISSPFTYRSFVKQIADLIGVDFATVAPDVQAASSTMPEPLVPGQEEEVFVRPHQFQPAKPKRNMTWIYGTASVAALAGAISGYLIWHSSTAEARPTENLPSGSKIVAPESSSTSVQANSDPVPIRSEQVAAPTVLTPVTERTETPRPPATGVEQLAPPAKEVPQLSSYAMSDVRTGSIHIELSAIERTWLSIEEDGKTTYTGVLAAMETKVFDSKSKVRIRTVNAGGVNVIFNGRALGPLGRHGQSRTFIFTKKGYEVVQGASNAAMRRLSPTGD